MSLPFRRNDGGANDGKRIRLQVPGDHDPGDAEVIAVPDWWRMIGAMNDADKASLKRLSFAFMRRFAFVPVPLPSPEAYEALIQSAAASSKLDSTQPEFVEGLKAVFARADFFASFDKRWSAQLAGLRYGTRIAFDVTLAEGTPPELSDGSLL